MVIGGWRAGEGGRSSGIGSLLCGIPDGGGLRFIGRVGTGFTDKDLAAVGTETFNEAVSVGAYYNLTKSVTLVGEVVNEETGVDGAVAKTKTNTVSLGAILFF